jgi:hypothetical protein
LTEQLKKEQEQTNNLKAIIQSLTNEKGLLANQIKVLEAREKTNADLRDRDIGHLQNKIRYLEQQAAEDKKNLEERLRQLGDEIKQEEQDKKQLKTQLESEKRDKETKIQELKEAK